MPRDAINRSVEIQRRVDGRRAAGGDCRFQLQLADEPLHVVYMDTEQLGGLAVTPRGLLHRGANNIALGLPNSIVISANGAPSPTSDHDIRKILRQDFVGGAKDHSVFDGVLQFAYVAGPSILH